MSNFNLPVFPINRRGLKAGTKAKNLGVERIKFWESLSYFFGTIPFFLCISIYFIEPFYVS